MSAFKVGDKVRIERWYDADEVGVITAVGEGDDPLYTVTFGDGEYTDERAKHLAASAPPSAELTPEQKKLLYQIEQWRKAALRDADKPHRKRLAEIDHDYRYRMVDAGLEAYIEPGAASAAVNWVIVACASALAELHNLAWHEITRLSGLAFSSGTPASRTGEAVRDNAIDLWTTVRDMSKPPASDALADAQATIADLTATLEAIARQRVEAPRDIPADEWGKGYATAMIKYTGMARDALNRIASADAEEAE